MHLLACRRPGAVLTFLPRDALTIERGEAHARENRFDKEAISHRFCPTCGIQTFSFGTMPDGTAAAMVNVNCLEVRKTATVFDGATC